MPDMSSVEAESIVKRALDMEIGHQKLKKEYILDLKSKSILVGTKFLRYYQIETKLIAIFKNQLTEVVPLVPVKKDNTK